MVHLTHFKMTERWVTIETFSPNLHYFVKLSNQSLFTFCWVFDRRTANQIFYIQIFWGPKLRRPPKFFKIKFFNEFKALFWILLNSFSTKRSCFKKTQFHKCGTNNAQLLANTKRQSVTHSDKVKKLLTF